MAHMLMIKRIRGAGITDDIPAFHNNDYLINETENERRAAMLIIDNIMSGLRISWTDISTELDKRTDKDWFDAGDPVNLDMLL